MAGDAVVKVGKKLGLVALDERARLVSQNAAEIRLDVRADVRHALDRQLRLDGRIGMGEHDVRHVRHHGCSEAERTRFDGREQDGLVVPFPERLTASEQRLELGVPKLAAEFGLARPPTGDDLSADRDNRADRILPCSSGGLRLAERLAHESLEVEGGHERVHGNSVADRALAFPTERSEMKIAVIGRGNVGGGLADRWEKTGHDVTRIGKDGGDVSEAEVLLLAVPGGAVADALDKVSGIDGKTVIDATNLIGADPPGGFASNAEFVKSKTNGPTAKSFNLNFARLYDQIESARAKPGNIYVADDEARQTTEQLIRDAGYDPVYGGTLENAAAQEHFIKVIFAAASDGPVFHRFAPPDEL